MSTETLSFQDIEILAVVCGWCQDGVKKLKALPVEDIDVGFTFMGFVKDGDMRGVSQGQFNEAIETMAGDIDRVREKIKRIYGV